MSLPPDHGLAVRASDHEREQHIDVLRRHAADGRLTVDELEERVEGAYTARTREQLAAVLAELPVQAESASAPLQARPATRRRLRSSELGPYIGVNLLLIAVWGLAGGGFFWPIWPILGWGIAIASHSRVRSSTLSPRCGARRRTGVRAPGG